MSIYSASIVQLSNLLSQTFQEKLNALESRKKLILENPEKSRDKREEQISQLFSLIQENTKESIQQLDVSKVDLSVEELLSLVSRLPCLKKLKINVKKLWCKHELNSEQLNELLKRCTELVSLTLKHSTLSSEAFGALKQCSQLQEVDLRYSTAIDGRIFIYLAQASSLKRINLAHCSKVDDQSLSKIPVESLPWEELNVSNCQGEFSQTLAKMPGLPLNFKLIQEEEDW